MEDTYILSGKVLHLIQSWEEIFKKVTIKYGIEKSDDKRSLSNMNAFMFKSKYFNEQEYLDIKKIIEIRNMVIHRLFLDFAKKEDIINYLKSSKEKIEESISFLMEMENKSLFIK